MYLKLSNTKKAISGFAWMVFCACVSVGAQDIHKLETGRTVDNEHEVGSGVVLLDKEIGELVGRKQLSSVEGDWLGLIPNRQPSEAQLHTFGLMKKMDPDFDPKTTFPSLFKNPSRFHEFCRFRVNRDDNLVIGSLGWNPTVDAFQSRQQVWTVTKVGTLLLLGTGKGRCFKFEYDEKKHDVLMYRFSFGRVNEALVSGEINGKRVEVVNSKGVSIVADHKLLAFIRDNQQTCFEPIPFRTYRRVRSETQAKQFRKQE